MISTRCWGLANYHTGTIINLSTWVVVGSVLVGAAYSLIWWYVRLRAGRFLLQTLYYIPSSVLARRHCSVGVAIIVYTVSFASKEQASNVTL